MNEVDSLLERAKCYRMMVKSVADEVAIHAMNAMAEYLEYQAMQLINNKIPGDSPSALSVSGKACTACT